MIRVAPMRYLRYTLNGGVYFCAVPPQPNAGKGEMGEVGGTFTNPRGAAPHGTPPYSKELPNGGPPRGGGVGGGGC